MRAMRPTGFTLVEMMVVMVVSVLLMTMSLSIFQVSSRTIQRIERRLAVYEAARNTLDRLDSEIQSAFANEKGDSFCIKACNYLDTDPFTPAAIPKGSDKKFYQSRREMDAIYFLKKNPGARYSISTYNCSAWNPFAEAGLYSDLWRAYIRPNLLYGYLQSPYTVTGYRNTLLADVSQIGAAEHSENRGANTGDWTDNSTGVDVGWASNELMTLLSPGAEKNAPNDPGSGLFANDHNVGNLMDLDIAYWDNTVQKFVNLPDFTAVYFAPPPQAVRVTITVCDRDKRDSVTLSRVIKIPVGNGSGAIQDTRDTDYANPSYPYNRTKNLKTLEPNI
jgi:prepilin-type N-terminal cleavage/methylation domain-containing protein